MLKHEWRRRGVVALIAVALGAGPALANEITVAHHGRAAMGLPHGIALAKGFYKEAGIDVTGIVTGDGGGTTVRNILASEFKYGEVSMPAAHAAWKSGVPVVLINGGVTGQQDQYVIAKKESPYNGIGDLVGRKVAITNPKGGSDIFVRMSLAKAGIAADKVNIVAAGGLNEALTLLSVGGVDIAFAAEPIWTARKLSERYKIVFRIDDYTPPMMGYVGMTTRDFAAKNGAKLRAILAARAKAVDFLRNNPDKSAALAAKIFNMAEADAKALLAVYRQPFFWSDGDFDLASMDALMDALKAVGVVPDEKIDWAAFVDRSFLPKAALRQ